MTQDRDFHVGIALAGGATRGAYSAGVMDFFLQALSEWEKLRLSAEQDPVSVSHPLPPWSVKLRALAGTSAGGITAAITASSISTEHEFLPNTYNVGDKPPHRNSLFKTWIKTASKENLLSCTDLDPSQGRVNPKLAKPIKSLLNSNFMSTQADEALKTDSKTTVPRWAEGLQLYFTTSNLRGVPYSVENFQGVSKELSDFRMTRHRDWVGFKTNDLPNSSLLDLDLESDRNGEQWGLVKAAAQATATFPLAFPAMTITIPRHTYESKLHLGSPAWPEAMPSEYVYEAVDGGVFRNEPMELLRASMECGEDAVLSHQVAESRGSMILLHPSPRRGEYSPEYGQNKSSLLGIAWGMLSALMEEANFHQNELEVMTAEDDISRFLIAPVRRSRKTGQDVLATDTLQGFGGIIDEEIRVHDFQLGRRNCQKFLMSHFAVPLELAKQNPIFGEDAEQFKQEYEGKMFVPIIPLYGKAKETCPAPKWPQYNASKKERILNDLHQALEKRIRTVLQCFAVNLGFYKNGFRFGVTGMWNYVVDKLVGIATWRVMNLADAPTRQAMEQFAE